jgi:hypothetical protein
MKSWLNEWITFIALLYYCTPVVWRQLNGGFFPWRDTPTWVIKYYLDMVRNADEAAKNEIDAVLYPEAVAELQLRHNLARRNDPR